MRFDYIWKVPLLPSHCDLSLDVQYLFWQVPVNGCSAVSCDFVVFMRRGGCPYTPPSCLHSLPFEFVFIDLSFLFLPLSSSLEIW
mgnify:CR=1 FL=1